MLVDCLWIEPHDRNTVVVKVPLEVVQVPRPSSVDQNHRLRRSSVGSGRGRAPLLEREGCLIHPEGMVEQLLRQGIRVAAIQVGDPLACSTVAPGGGAIRVSTRG